MKILKSTSLLFAAVFAVSSIYGLKIGLPLQMPLPFPAATAFSWQRRQSV